MIWLNPAAWLAIALVAAPILIHILVQRRAERVPFPTLRFIQPTRLAAIRRHVLKDAALLAVRAAIVAAAVAALAGPVLLTAARRHAWNARTSRAIVVVDGARAFPPLRGASADDGSFGGGRQASAAAAVARTSDGARGFRPSDATFRTQRFDTDSLPDGIRRAVAWLDDSPPARREVVVFSEFAIGSLAAADVAAIPAGFGIAFERAGTLPATRTVAAGHIFSGVGRVLLDPVTASGVVARDVTLEGPKTVVRDTPAGESVPWPIDVVAAPESRSFVEAAIAAVRAERVWAPPADRRARLVLVSTDVDDGTVLRPSPTPTAFADVATIRQPWMADAVARIARDVVLQRAGSHVASGLRDARFAAAPWQTVATAADGRLLVVAAGSPNQLMVASAAPASDLVTPLLMRVIANSLAVPFDLQRAEVLAIPDDQLRRWTRPAPAPDGPRIDRLEDDDRRWLWAASLVLLALEGWMRRGRPSAAVAEHEEAARVA